MDTLVRKRPCPEHYHKVGALFAALLTINVGDAAIGTGRFGILVFWPRLGITFHLPPSGLAGWLRGDGDC